MDSFNRTIKELKPCYVLGGLSALNSFNRTIKELKQYSATLRAARSAAFNRTIKELKRKYSRNASGGTINF